MSPITVGIGKKNFQNVWSEAPLNLEKTLPHTSRFILVLELFSLSTFLRLIFLRPATNSVDYSRKVIYSDSKLFISSPYYALKRSRICCWNGHFKLDRCLLNAHPISYSFHNVKYFWIHGNTEKISGCVVLSQQKNISEKEWEAERINAKTTTRRDVWGRVFLNSMAFRFKRFGTFSFLSRQW